MALLEHITALSESFTFLYKHTLKANHRCVWLSLLLIKHIYKLFRQFTLPLKHENRIIPLSCLHFYVLLKYSLGKNPLKSVSVLAKHVQQSNQQSRKTLHVSQRYSDHTIFICTRMYKEKSSTDRNSDFCFLILSRLEKKNPSCNICILVLPMRDCSQNCFLLIYSRSHKLYNQKKHCVIQSVLLIEQALWLL